MTGPLSGIRVVDFGRLAVGPAAGMYLGQLGAEVIKIESPTGDDSRTVAPLKQGMSMVYMTVNSNKKNILLDLRASADLETAKQLVAIADVLIENFRPGVMDRLGLGYAEVSKTNPGIVYCAASGYGTRGPMSGLRSSDHFGQAIGGFVSLNGEVGGRPQFLRQSGFVDMATAQRLTEGVVAALVVRERTGRGQKVETTQLEASLGLVASRAAEYFATGVTPGPLGSAASVSAPHEAFEAEDGQLICVAVQTQPQWEQLRAALGMSSLDADARFSDNAGRVEHREALAAILRDVFIAHPAQVWYDRLTAAGVPAAIHWADPTYAAMKRDPHVVANQLFEAVETPWGVVDIVRPPWRFSATPATLTRSPRPDEHAEEIRAIAAIGTAPASRAASGQAVAGAPLAGLKVVDLSQGYAGPAAAMVLGDLGADVVKVEPPEGDYTRRLGPPFVQGESAVFLGLNRSKRGIVLDLTTVEGQAQAHRLLANADVVIADLQPDEARARGVDFERLHALNLRLVYCSVTPWGESGPYSGRPGGELVLQVASGVLRYVGPLGGAPVRLGADVAGATAATFASIGIFAALLDRERRGEGQKVEVDELLSLLASQCTQIARESGPDKWEGPVLAVTHPPDHPPRTADLPVHIGFRRGGRGDEGWRTFFTDLGLPDMADDPRFADDAARAKNQRDMLTLLEARWEQLPSAEVLHHVHEMEADGVPCHTIASLRHDPQVEAMGLLVAVSHPTVGDLVGIDVPFDLVGTPHRVTMPPPLLGQHTAEVLASLD